MVGAPLSPPPSQRDLPFWKPARLAAPPEAELLKFEQCQELHFGVLSSELGKARKIFLHKMGITSKRISGLRKFNLRLKGEENQRRI